MTFPQISPPDLAEVQAQFSLFDFIAGERITPAVEMGGFVHNPHTGEVIAPQKATTPEAVERALQTAQRLHGVRTHLGAGVVAQGNHAGQNVVLHLGEDLQGGVESVDVAVLLADNFQQMRDEGFVLRGNQGFHRAAAFLPV